MYSGPNPRPSRTSGLLPYRSLHATEQKRARMFRSMGIGRPHSSHARSAATRRANACSLRCFDR